MKLLLAGLGRGKNLQSPVAVIKTVTCGLSPAVAITTVTSSAVLPRETNFKSSSRNQIFLIKTRKYLLPSLHKNTRPSYARFSCVCVARTDNRFQTIDRNGNYVVVLDLSFFPPPTRPSDLLTLHEKVTGLRNYPENVCFRAPCTTHPSPPRAIK